MLECNVCHGKIFGSPKFCPQCGDPVTAEDRPVSDVAESQAAMVEISFGKSSSPNYSRAIDICRRIPTFRAASDSGGIASGMSPFESRAGQAGNQADQFRTNSSSSTQAGVRRSARPRASSVNERPRRERKYTPTLFVLDGNNKIVVKIIGVMTPDQVDDLRKLFTGSN